MSENDVPAAPGPYKGLAPFEDSERDALLFFGRNTEREIITANLQASRLTVLYGPSGCGKSSVLRAGVAHALRRQAETNVADGHGPEHAVVVFDRWSDDPAEGIATAVAEAVGALAGPLENENGAAALSERVGAWVRHLGGELYLVLDQAEEYFLYRPLDEQDEFARELPELVGRPDLPVNILVSLREDALGRLDMFRAGIPALFGNTLRLALLDGAAAREAVVGPLGRYAGMTDALGPVEIEPELVDAVLADTRAGEIELAAGAGSGPAAGSGEGVETAFLQLVLRRLWATERQAGSRTLRLETFRELGGAERIVQDHLGAALAALTPEQRDAAAAAFNHLVTPSGTKVAHGLSDLATYSGVLPAFLAPVMASLAEQRIVRPLPPADGSTDPRYEIFHDVLAGPILGWRSEHETERRFAGERNEARRRHRRLLGVTIASLVALVIAVGLAIFALSQRSEAQEQEELARASLDQARESEERAEASAEEARDNAREASAAQQDAEEQAEVARNEARISRARQLAAVATTQLAVDPELSLLLTLEAARLEPLPEFADVLRQSLLTSRVQLVLRAEAAINAAAYSRDDTLIVTASDDGFARVYNAETGDLLQSIEHGQPVNAGAFSPNGQLVATGGDDGTARVVPAGGASADGDELVLEHDGPVTSLAFDPSGAFLATGSRDSTARVWDITTREGIVLPHPAPVTLVAFDPTGGRLATAAEDDVVRVWSTSGDMIGDVRHDNRVTSISWRFDGDFLATTSADRTAILWVPSSGDTQPLTGPKGPFLAGEFSPDGTLLATGSSDGAFRTWIVPGGRRRNIVVAHANHVTDVSFSPDGSYLVTASLDRTARVWRVATGAPITTLAGHSEAVVSAVFSHDSGEILTAGADGTARVWDSSALPDLRELGRHPEPVLSASFSPDGSLAVSASEDGTARIWRTSGTGRAIVLRHGVAAVVTAASFSADGETVITAGTDGTVRLWSASDGQALRTFDADAPVSSAALSPDGSLVAAGSDDGLTRLWQVDSGALMVRIRHRSAVSRVTFSTDGTRLVSASTDRRAKVADARTGEVLATLRGHRGQIVDAAFSQDGQLVATASLDRTARLWDASSGEELGTLIGHQDDLTSVSFSPDGRKVLTTSVDGDGRTWDATTGDPLATLRVHFAVVSDASFSPDGAWIVTAGPAAAAIVNADTGRPLVFPLTGHSRRLTSASFAEDGRHVLTSSRDGTVRIYDCEACGPLEDLIGITDARLERTGRELTVEERERYLGE